MHLGEVKLSVEQPSHGCRVPKGGVFKGGVTGEPYNLKRICFRKKFKLGKSSPCHEVLLRKNPYLFLGSLL